MVPLLHKALFPLRLFVATVVLAAISSPTGAAAQTEQYIIQYKHNPKFAVPLSDDEVAVPANRVLKRNRHGRILAARLSASEAEEVRRHRGVEAVEPNHPVALSYTPNDPRLPELHGLLGGKGIRAEQAWDVTTGDPAKVIAVVDTGVDYTHPDLAPNIWTNNAEIPGNRVDDDGNGLIDDYRGYDFANEDSSPMDGHGHGTHVAGTIAAAGDNGAGVAGVAFGCKILPLKALGDSGYGSYYDIIQGIDYAINLKKSGVPIVAINLSIGGTYYSVGWYRAMQRARDADIVVLAAAGNSSANADLDPEYPAAFDVPNIISVAAIDQAGWLASFSNFGRRSVDIAAPGEDILSTYPTFGVNDGYATLSGTSMATPHLSGVAGLVASANGNITARQIRKVILATAQPTTHLSSLTASGGFVNAAAAVNRALTEERRLEVYGYVKQGARGVPNVTVRVRPVNGTPGEARRAVSKTDGSFTISGLVPGEYVVSASQVGVAFAKRTHSIALTSDKKVSFSVAR